MPNIQRLGTILQVYQLLSYIMKVNGFNPQLPEVFSNWVPVTRNFLQEYASYPPAQRFFINCLTQLAAANTSGQVTPGFFPLYPAVVDTLNSETIDPALKAALTVLFGLGQCVIAGIGSPELNSIAGTSSASLAKHLLSEVLKIGPGGATSLNFKPKFKLPNSHYIKFGVSKNPNFMLDCSLVIENIAQTNKQNRYRNFLGQSKNDIFDPLPIVPVLLPAVSAISLANSGLFIVSAIVGTSIVGGGIIGALVLFQRAQKRRYLNMDNKSIIIDVDSIDVDILD